MKVYRFVFVFILAVFSKLLCAQVALVSSSSPLPFAMYQKEKCMDAKDLSNCTFINIINHINENYFYPPFALENKQEGKVYLRIIVNEKGEMIAIDIADSSGFEILDQAAIKILENLADEWFPGIDESGNPVTSALIVPINFKIGKGKSVKQKKNKKK